MTGWLLLARVCTAVLALLFVNLAGSLATIRRLDKGRLRTRSFVDWPFVSVLIPARNEAQNIQDCLLSLCRQSYPRFEIIVLDDQSTDGTGQIVSALAEEDLRVHLMAGRPLPPDWLGKCHACWQLAEVARGDYLLFTDADTIHGPDSIAQALGWMEQGHLGLLTALPRQRAVTFWERLILPLLPLNILMLLPVGLVSRRPEPSLSAGVGQFLCFRRAAYEAVGGHAAVRNQVLDDVMLARRTKLVGYRTDLVDGSSGVQCRMYRSLDEIWRGFSKNLFDFYGRSIPATLIAILLRFLFFVLPPFATLLSLFTPHSDMLAMTWLMAWLFTIAIRLVLALRYGTDGTSIPTGGWWSALLFPFAEAIHCAITLNSLRWGVTGKASWKGREVVRTS